MERTIALSDLRRVVDEAYEQFKSDKEGTVDQRVADADSKTFGISIVLADGTVISKGDADTKAPMGDIVKVPLHQVLLSQMSVDDIIKRSCEADRFRGEKPAKPHHLGISAHGIRAVSAIEPTGDREGKYDIIINDIIDLMGGDAPELDVKLYESLQAQNATAGVTKAITDTDYKLYDDVDLSVDIYTRLTALRASAKQLATMGATIAADGVCPTTERTVFDGEQASTVVAMMAAMGPRRINRPWLVSTGLPAKSGFGGGIVGVLPGVFGVGVVAPALDGAGTSVKGIKAVTYIMRKLNLSAFSSAKVVIDKNR